MTGRDRMHVKVEKCMFKVTLCCLAVRSEGTFSGKSKSAFHETLKHECFNILKIVLCLKCFNSNMVLSDNSCSKNSTITYNMPKIMIILK